MSTFGFRDNLHSWSVVAAISVVFAVLFGFAYEKWWVGPLLVAIAAAATTIIIIALNWAVEKDEQRAIKKHEQRKG